MDWCDADEALRREGTGRCERSSSLQPEGVRGAKPTDLVSARRVLGYRRYTLWLMDLPICVKAFDEHGIKLIPPTYTDFDELAGPPIGRVAEIGLKLKPMLMIVSNESPQTVVFYSKAWTSRYAGGRTSVIRGHTTFPETVCGDILIAEDPEALPPGAKRVETPSLVI